MDLINSLINLTELKILVLGLMVITVIAAISVAVITVVRKIKVTRIGPMEMGKEGKQHTAHYTCIHAKDILDVLHRQAEVLNEIRDLRAALIPTQMRRIDAIVMESKGILQKTFVSILQDKLDEEFPGQYAIDTRDYQLFRMSLSTIEVVVKDFYKACFQANHLAQKTESDFKDYISYCSAQIIQTVTDSLNDLYRGDVLKRSLLYKENQKIIPELKDKIEEGYMYAREITIDMEKQIKDKSESFDRYFSRVFG